MLTQAPATAVQHATVVLTHVSHGHAVTHYSECTGCPWAGRKHTLERRATKDGERHTATAGGTDGRH